MHYLYSFIQIVVSYSLNCLRQRKHRLSEVAPEQRDFLRRFASQRVAKPMPEAPLALRINESPATMYYVPDDKEEVQELVFHYKDEELYTYEQAMVEWKKRGCKSQRNILIIPCIH